MLFPMTARLLLRFQNLPSRSFASFRQHSIEVIRIHSDPERPDLPEASFPCQKPIHAREFRNQGWSLIRSTCSHSPRHAEASMIYLVRTAKPDRPWIAVRFSEGSLATNFQSRGMSHSVTGGIEPPGRSAPTTTSLGCRL